MLSLALLLSAVAAKAAALSQFIDVADGVWPGYSNCRDESCLGVNGEAWENQMKTDAENA